MMKKNINIILPFVCLLFVVLLASGAFENVYSQGITIDVRQLYPMPYAPEKFQNGYRQKIDGQSLQYHSCHPDADTALLVRAQKETQSISWQSDILRPSGENYSLIWLAGLEKSGWGDGTPPHTFILNINGERWFTFTNRKDSSAGNWTVTGNAGAKLSFKSQMTDKYGDLFGYMYLRLPNNYFKAGKPLTFQVVGEDAGSMEWYMTFQYSFNFTPRVRMEPALLREPSGEKQMLRVSIDNLEDMTYGVVVKTPSGDTINGKLNLGSNIFMIPVPKVVAAMEVPVSVTGVGIKYNSTIRILPVQKRDVYLLPYSHNDIGYTDLQPIVRRKQWDNIEQSLNLIARTKAYPPEAQYKWNVEILWPLESYLKQASDEQRREVLDAIRAGSIGLNALYVNPLTGLANAVEMSHFTDYAHELKKDYSIDIPNALVSDIPGFTWGLVPALGQSGVKYFSSSPNNGDRVGYIYDWGDKPFYWASQSGKEKILFWMAGSGYAMFHEGSLAKLGDEKILNLMRKFEESGYRYDMIQLPYTLGDNGGTDSTLSDFVKSWNERYVSPRLIIATHKQMFEDFEKRYGDSLQTYKGDFTPYWEDGAQSTAYETAENRAAVNTLIQGEALWSMQAPYKFPSADYTHAWRDVSLYDEHTWGAANSVTDPDNPDVKGQWTIKQQFVREADSLANTLYIGALPAASKSNGDVNIVDVFNTSSWTRSDIVYLTPEQSSAGDAVVDAVGNIFHSQRLSTGELAVIVDDIKPMSAKRIIVKSGKTFYWGKAAAQGYTLSSSQFDIGLNPRTGGIDKLTWKKNNIQLVDSRKNLGLNQCIYIAGTNPDSANYLNDITIKVGEQGPLVASLIIEAKMRGCRSFAAEIRLVDGIERVDIIDQIDKLPVRDKEGMHFAFPFNVTSGQIHYDVANGLVRPELDQLQGACKNFFSVQNWVDISNADHGVTLATLDAPLIEIGAITAESPWMRTVQPSQLIYSYVMNNYWHTNYKADQEGVVRFRYAIAPHENETLDKTVRFGREQREPFIASFADTSKEPTQTLFQLDPPEVVAASVRPWGFGNAWLLYLYNTQGIDQNVRIRWNANIPVTMFTADAAGNTINPVERTVPLAAMGSGYVLVVKK